MKLHDAIIFPWIDTAMWRAINHCATTSPQIGIPKLQAITTPHLLQIGISKWWAITAPLFLHWLISPYLQHLHRLTIAGFLAHINHQAWMKFSTNCISKWRPSQRHDISIERFSKYCLSKWHSIVAPRHLHGISIWRAIMEPPYLQISIIVGVMCLA